MKVCDTRASQSMNYGWVNNRQSSFLASGQRELRFGKTDEEPKPDDLPPPKLINVRIDKPRRLGQAIQGPDKKVNLEFPSTKPSSVASVPSAPRKEKRKLPFTVTIPRVLVLLSSLFLPLVGGHTPNNSPADRVQSAIARVDKDFEALKARQHGLMAIPSGQAAVRDWGVPGAAAASNPNIPALNYKAISDDITQKEARRTELLAGAAGNQGNATRTRLQALKHSFTGSTEDKAWHKFYTERTQEYTQKANAQRADALALAKEILDLKIKRLEMAKAGSDALTSRWGQVISWHHAKRIDQFDARLKLQWPANVKVFTESSTAFPSWMNLEGSFFLEDLCKNAPSQPDLQSMHRSVNGYSIITDEEIDAQIPMESTGKVQVFRKVDNAQMAPYRRLLFIVGQGNPGESSWDEESFKANVQRIRLMAAKEFGVIDDYEDTSVPANAKHIVILNQPDIATLEKAKQEMIAFADRCIAETSHDGKTPIKPEGWIIIGGHGGIYDKSSSDSKDWQIAGGTGGDAGLQAGLGEADKDKEGAYVGGVCMQRPAGDRPGLILGSLYAKQFAQDIASRYKGLYFTMQCCHAGGFLAKNDSTEDQEDLNRVLQGLRARQDILLGTKRYIG